MITPLKGKVTSPFGSRVHPVTGEKGKFHNGIDISAPIGTPIVAPVDGVIKAIYTHKTGGKTLILQGNDGKRYGFAHLDRYDCRVGDRVMEGDIIAKSGNTGASTGPHLHLTVKDGGSWVGSEYLGGEFVDPELFFNF